MQLHGYELSPEVAEYLLSLALRENDQERMQQLAERSKSGELTGPCPEGLATSFTSSASIAATRLRVSSAGSPGINIYGNR